MKKSGVKKKGPGVKLDSSLHSHERRGVAEEIERLRGGGEFNETWLRKLSAEDRALFEIMLIDSLTKWSREDQHQLRSTLIKHGYDEQCARRMMKDKMPDQVRAATLLRLLRPQSNGPATNPNYRRRTGPLNLSPSSLKPADETEEENESLGQKPKAQALSQSDAV